MFPLGDDLPAGRRPYVNWAIMLACLAVFWHEVRITNAEAEALILERGLVPSALMADPLGEAPRLLTHMFMHANLFHLSGNLLFLWVFGKNVEAELGHLGYAAFFIVGGALAGAASIAGRPDSPVPGIGASGAIAAILAAYLVLHPLAQIRVLAIIPWTIIFALFQQRLPIYDVPAWILLVIWFGLQLFGGLSSTLSPSGVDYFAHIGGFAAGYLAIRGLRLFGFWPDDSDARRDRSPRPTQPNTYVVARRLLRAGAVLAEADLQWTQRRYELVDAQAVPARDLASLAGRRLCRDRYPLEAIRWDDLEPLPETTAIVPQPGA